MSEREHRLFHSPAAVLHYRAEWERTCVCVYVHAHGYQQAAACWRQTSRRASSLKGVTSTYAEAACIKDESAAVAAESTAAHGALACIGEHKRGPKCPSFSSSRGVKSRLATDRKSVV